MDYNKNEVPFFSSSYNFELSEISETMSCSSKQHYIEFSSINNISDEETNRFMLYSNERFMTDYANRVDSCDDDLISSPSKNTKTIVSGKSKYNKGRWNSNELRLFVEGLVLHGNEWKKIQTIIKTRSATQTRSHAQKFFLRLRKKVDITQSSENIRNFVHKFIQNCIHQNFKPKRNFYEIVFSILFTPDELKLLNEKSKNTKRYFSIQKVHKDRMNPIFCEDNESKLIPLGSC